jgi:hypothetical protein
MAGALPRNALCRKVTSKQPLNWKLRKQGGRYGEAFSRQPRFSNHDGVL